MTDNSPTYGQADASYQAAGGLEGIRQLVTDFYQEMDSWEGARELRALHAEDLTLAREKLTAFLSGWLGGPRLFQQQFGSISIPAFHARWAVGPELRDQWLDCMERFTPLLPAICWSSSGCRPTVWFKPARRCVRRSNRDTAYVSVGSSPAHTAKQVAAPTLADATCRVPTHGGTDSAVGTRHVVSGTPLPLGKRNVSSV